MHSVLITGGADFIGQNLVHGNWLREVTGRIYKAWVDKNRGLRIAV